jgi:hypothetical protein
MVTLNNFVDGSVVDLLFSLTQMDKNVKIIIRVFWDRRRNFTDTISLTQYARFPGKI